MTFTREGTTDSTRGGREEVAGFEPGAPGAPRCAWLVMVATRQAEAASAGVGTRS